MFGFSFFLLGYRRITAEVDIRHLIGRKFLEQCGFLFECELRKHKIAFRRNRDTAVYAILNSEWPEVEIKLKYLLKIPLIEPGHKIAEIGTADVVNITKVATKKDTKLAPQISHVSLPTSNNGGNRNTQKQSKKKK